jgi:molybdenum cofactor cytidylyltransferase/nicotine blue oxidoreductase
MWQDALAMAEPDEGARSYLAANHQLVDLVPVPGDPSDVDRPEDLVRWQRQGNRPPHRRE